MHAEPDRPISADDVRGEAGDDTSAHARRRPVVVAGIVVAVVAVVALGALVFGGGDDGPPPATVLPIDAWVPYWALEDALADFDRTGPALRELSPFWYRAESATDIVRDEHAPAELADRLLERARELDVPLVPSIVDGTTQGGMAAILADPASRATHVDAIARFAADLGVAGIDLDYEGFAFVDDRSTWETTRPHWVTFVGELAARLHAEGRILTVSIPPVYDGGRTEDSGYWVYDYAAIAPLVDRIRVMAYDYSTAEPGPIAPLPWVAEVVEATAEVSGAPEKLVLGIPLYGYNWPVRTVGTCPDQESRTAVTIRSVGELIALRTATPVLDPEVAEWGFTYNAVFESDAGSCTQTRQVAYVGSAEARQRVELALAAGFGGAALWALGYDDATVWAELDPLVAPRVAG